MKTAHVLADQPKLSIVILLAALIIQLLLLLLWLPAISAFLLATTLAIGGVKGSFASGLTGLAHAILHKSTLFARVQGLLLPQLTFEMVSLDVPTLQPDYSAAESILVIVPSVGRLALTAIFLGSYLLKPLHGAFSTLWLRVVESDKPIFTLLFGGAAAAAKGIEAVIEALH
jgi:hypothetical protein